MNEPAGDWGAENSPARYADTMEFGIQLNRRFYREMKDFLKALGAKAPIATSNLLGGAADVYGHTDGDLMENNSYFNHPILPVRGNTYVVGGLQEYVSMNPLTMQQGYGAYPFHSTAFVQMAAYACLNDWDGLILYAHHTSEKWDNQPADEIHNIIDAYNDPSLICPSPPFPWTASPFRRRKRCSSPLWGKPAWMKLPKALWSSSLACPLPPVPSRASCTPIPGKAL